MWFILITLVIILAALGWLWITKADSEPNSDIPVYICPECGDKHCNCYLEKD